VVLMEGGGGAIVVFSMELHSEAEAVTRHLL